MKTDLTTVEAYIKTFPNDVQEKLNTIRNIIIENAPGVIETISYGMPAYKTYKKPLIYFAGYDKHIGFYATPTGHEAFAEELSIFKQGKGSVQFPINTLLPTDLIARIVKFRVKENEEKFKKK
jgi:uncharacterized protein YdhG (YjbR/CyaY superfamily)